MTGAPLQLLGQIAVGREDAVTRLGEADARGNHGKDVSAVGGSGSLECSLRFGGHGLHGLDLTPHDAVAGGSVDGWMERG